MESAIRSIFSVRTRYFSFSACSTIVCGNDSSNFVLLRHNYTKVEPLKGPKSSRSFSIHCVQFCFLINKRGKERGGGFGKSMKSCENIICHHFLKTKTYFPFDNVWIAPQCIFKKRRFLHHQVDQEARWMKLPPSSHHWKAQGRRRRRRRRRASLEYGAGTSLERHGK